MVEIFYQVSVSDILTPWSDVNAPDATSKVQGCKSIFFLSVIFCSTLLSEEDMAGAARILHVSPLYTRH